MMVHARARLTGSTSQDDALMARGRRIAAHFRSQQMLRDRTTKFSRGPVRFGSLENIV
jgi:hypothetical protein